ncbi:MAG: hypothetical protein ABI633_01730 [Burkholderiales bacterium]
MNTFARVFRQSLTCYALGCSLASGMAGAQAVAAPPDELAFAAAQEAYDISHWAEAHAAFAALADQGDAESARIALQMWRQGQVLYGRAFEVTPEQAQRWRLLLNCRAEDAGAGCVLVSSRP